MLRRRSLIALAVAALSALGGCGWKPLYADRESRPAIAGLRAITVAPIAERIGQQLELGLRESLNPDGEPTPQLYQLRTILAVGRASVGVQSQGLGTRGNTNATANIQLIEIKSGKVLLNASLHAMESFDIQANEYSTVVAQNDTDSRLAEELRQEIVDRLTLFLQHQEQDKEKEKEKKAAALRAGAI
jgi:LPS-assembly lipoprotein